MTAIADAGPLIHLSRLDLLYLVHELFGEVLIPQAVLAEVLRPGMEATGVRALEAALAQGWLRHWPMDDSGRLIDTVRALGPGETEAIALALQERAQFVLLLDDGAARDEAFRRGLPVTGTIGILRAARDAGLIDAAYPILVALQRRGFWISAKLLERIRNEES